MKTSFPLFPLSALSALSALSVFTVLFTCLPVSAQTEDNPEVLFGGGLAVRRTVGLDLAKIAEEPGYGQGDDAGPLALGLEARGAFRFPFDLEVTASGAVAVGGLDLGAVEQRYLGAQEDIGSTASVWGEAGLRYAPRLSDDLHALVGPQVGWHYLSASSPAGHARSALVAAGLDLGVRLRLHEQPRKLNHYLEFSLQGRREFPLTLQVSRDSASEDAVLFDSTSQSARIYSFGLSATYVFGLPLGD